MFFGRDQRTEMVLQMAKGQTHTFGVPGLLDTVYATSGLHPATGDLLYGHEEQELLARDTGRESAEDQKMGGSERILRAVESAATAG